MKLKPTIIASKKKAGDNIKLACEENVADNDSQVAAAGGSQNGKRPDKLNKKKKKKETSAAATEANLVERIALDLDELDLNEVSELVNNSGSGKIGNVLENSLNKMAHKHTFLSTFESPALPSELQQR